MVATPIFPVTKASNHESLAKTKSAVALGLCAAYLNWQSVSRKLEPRDYVAVNREIKAGEPLGAKTLKKVTISHTGSIDLRTALVPWDQKEALINRFMQRTVGKDCLLTQFDIYEKNIAAKRDTEEYLYVQQRTAPTYFVNDLVDVRDDQGHLIPACRILSISPIKEGYDIRLAIDSKRLQALKNKNLIQVDKLQIK